MPFYDRRATSCYTAAMTQSASSWPPARPRAWGRTSCSCRSATSRSSGARCGRSARPAFDDLLVVLGSSTNRSLAALEGLPCRHAINPDYATGMGSSFRTAVGSSARRARRCSRWPTSPSCGQPITGSCSRPTASAASAGSSAPRYGEVTAPPHVFDREFFPELAVLEHGARPVLQRHADRTIVPAPPAGPAPRHRHARRLRAGEGALSAGAMKTGVAAVEEACVEPAAEARRISPRIDTAISSGVSAPSASPIGLRTRARAAGPGRRRAPQRVPAASEARPRAEDADVGRIRGRARSAGSRDRARDGGS